MDIIEEDIGNIMHAWARDLYPICRSITGAGVRQTLDFIKSIIPELEIYSVASGTKVFDWEIPNEWNIRDAYIADEAGEKIIDFKQHNLHVVGYSEPVNKKVSLAELDKHLYSLPDQEDAIPYITSYYQKRWGFCLTHKQRQNLSAGNYQVYIDSDLKPGVLNYAEIILAGQSEKEIFLSTYICHPSMANNELSGPVVTMALVNWLKSLNNRRYTYRIVFVPETIGSITYLSKNIQTLRQNVYAGFNITCIGDDRTYSYLPSRNGETVADKVARHVLKFIDPDYKQYSWLDRGSDERQYCAPGVDLPIASIMRSKYGEYPEYHTSLDDLSLVTPSGLSGGFVALQKAVEILEMNAKFKCTTLGEPQLGKRDLYPTLSTKQSGDQVKDMMNLLTYCDGELSLLDIADALNKSFFDLLAIVKSLSAAGLIAPHGYKNCE